MGCCSSSLLLVDINPVNKVDRHLQKKAGQKLEEHLAQHNNRSAEDPDDYRKKAYKDTRVKGTGEEGKWGKTRQTLARAGPSLLLSLSLSLSLSLAYQPADRA